MINVLLVEDHELYRMGLSMLLSKAEDINLVAEASDGFDGVKKAREFSPDVILMDILLGERDGFWVLENLKKEGVNCVCIMISAIDSDKLVRQAIISGAEYYMAKPIQGELLLERIHQLLDHEVVRSPEKVQKEEVVEENPFRNLEGEISVLLSRMGISASIKGYHFIRKAVILALEDEEALVGITKGLYPDIAKAYKTSASKVERAIRHAIESAWKKNGPQIYFEVAGYLPSEKPTNGQFLSALSEYFRLHEERPKKIS